MSKIYKARLRKNLYDLRVAAQEIDATGRKLQRSSYVDKIKCKQAMKWGNQVKAKVHAENCINNINMSCDYVQTSARVCAIIYCVENAITNRQLHKNVEYHIKCLLTAVKDKDMIRAKHIMDIFEKDIENLGFKYAVVEKAVEKTISALIPQNNNDIETLMLQLAQEVKLEEVKLNSPPLVTDNLKC